MIEVKRLVNDDTEHGWYELDGVDPVTDMGFSKEVYMISHHCAKILDESGMTPDNPDEIRTVYRLANQYEAAYIAAGMPGREDYTLCLYPEAAISDFAMKSGGLQSYEEPAPPVTLKSIRNLEGECKKIMTKGYPGGTLTLAETRAEADTEERAEFRAAERDRIANLYGRGSPCAETFLAILGADLRKFLSSPEWLGAPLIEDALVENAFNRMPVIDPPDVIIHKTSAVGPTSGFTIKLPIQLSAHVQIDPPDVIAHKVELLPGTPSTLSYAEKNAFNRMPLFNDPCLGKVNKANRELPSIKLPIQLSAHVQIDNYMPSVCGECTNYKFMAGKCEFEMGLKEPNTKCTNEKFLPAGS